MKFPIELAAKTKKRKTVHESVFVAIGDRFWVTNVCFVVINSIQREYKLQCQVIQIIKFLVSVRKRNSGTINFVVLDANNVN